ncbi:hypothetical protein CYMTET_43805 [Cymbomonas tetramitiformis]|uniref:Uncharacterized protein n=1 Tax=Cymbomonas tetramitiformis TaxID=36881 RepID=A0AAE0EZX9_9CHLO|nr:hypothetical protein CYMTET_43805 [Cymbomonas tetramitiformis]
MNVELPCREWLRDDAHGGHRMANHNTLELLAYLEHRCLNECLWLHGVLDDATVNVPRRTDCRKSASPGAKL